jgi:hypothetical protein
VYFAVFDFGDAPHIITEIIGMEPTGAWVKGDWYESGLSNPRRTHSRWFLESGLDYTAAVGPQLDALLTKLESRQPQIALVQARFPAYIGIAQYFDELNPGFVLPRETLGRLAKLDLAVDFDQYYLGDE